MQEEEPSPNKLGYTVGIGTKNGNWGGWFSLLECTLASIICLQRSRTSVNISPPRPALRVLPHLMQPKESLVVLCPGPRHSAICSLVNCDQHNACATRHLFYCLKNNPEPIVNIRPPNSGKNTATGTVLIAGRNAKWKTGHSSQKQMDIYHMTQKCSMVSTPKGRKYILTEKPTNMIVVALFIIAKT